MEKFRHVRKRTRRRVLDGFVQASVREHDPFIAELLSLQPFLFNFALRLVKNFSSAEDFTQITLEKALTAREQFGANGKGTNLKAWLFTILRNEIYSRSRRGKVGMCVKVEMELQASETKSPASQYNSVLLTETLACIDKLPFHQKQALIFIAIDGRSYEEVAQMTGFAPGTIKSRFSRGREALLQMIENGHSL
ncbi:hypothetical protein A2841_03480 [Candidatus Kaiserbacteria bacterium RIFCSPHIGHO2_01_FULL_48_10]|uniref:Uncharacterized protein n=1 Tax=Candidatus Kaiserbacteria bacterium RIFCSPHIGHO2_01_FULL_48_10 TaxID=1798476 RepID=A0A1F6C2E5_9BACT|nr:MAG: hypothetical protein A2841_03480 [Candidatus Kaiserbacteria bacterium RIFCSPHIGHO2_01_FULL_48_10]